MIALGWIGPLGTVAKVAFLVTAGWWVFRGMRRRLPWPVCLLRLVALAATVWVLTGIWADGGTPREAVVRLHDWAAYLGVGALVGLAALALASSLTSRSRGSSDRVAPTDSAR